VHGVIATRAGIDVKIDARRGRRPEYSTGVCYIHSQPVDFSLASFIDGRPKSQVHAVWVEICCHPESVGVQMQMSAFWRAPSLT